MKRMGYSSLGARIAGAPYSRQGALRFTWGAVLVALHLTRDIKPSLRPEWPGEPNNPRSKRYPLIGGVPLP